MKWLQFLCVSCVVLYGNSQNVLQNPNILNPDHIYFDDNRPSTGKPVHRQINTPTQSLQPPYGNIDVVQVPVTRFNVIETSTHNWNNFQRPANGVNFVQRPVYDQTVAININSEDLQTSKGLQKIRFNQAAEALTNFSINVTKNVVSRKKGNTVVSPYSIATVLALLQQGATKLSLEQISVALQMSLQTSATVFRTQTQDIQNRRSHNILQTANNIFVADAFTLNPQFSMVAKRDFNVDVTRTSFERPNEAVRLINGWVASKTNNKINNLVSPDSISVNTQMVLVNTVYFKGLWATPFLPSSTKIDKFTLGNGAKINVPFMIGKRFFRTGVDVQTDSTVVILPFENDEYSLMIIVPSTLSSAENTLTSLTVSQLESYLNFKSIEVILKIPKFTIKADTDLAPVLKQMGVTQIFDQNSGLVGLGTYREFTPEISSAVHSAVISIDEDGTIAAAASAFSVVALSNDDMPLLIRVEKPFVAILWDEKTKVPLFMAKIEDPSIL